MYKLINLLLFTQSKVSERPVRRSQVISRNESKRQGSVTVPDIHKELNNIRKTNEKWFSLVLKSILLVGIYNLYFC